MSEAPGPPVTFPYAGPQSSRVKCSVCGSAGFPGGRWQVRHRAGHTQCPDCGRWMTVKLDGSARQHPSHLCHPERRNDLA